MRSMLRAALWGGLACMGCLGGRDESGGAPPAADARASSFADADLGGGGFIDAADLPPLADAAPATGGPEVTVPASVGWSDAGHDVARNDTMVFTATGTIDFGVGMTSDPDGSANLAYTIYSVSKPVRPAALIGKIGADGAPFRIGSAATIVAPVAGRLYLGVNDNVPGDNARAYRVTIAITPGGTLPAVTPGSVTTSVSSTTAWRDTGVALQPFEGVTFTTTGSFNVAPGIPATPDGITNPKARVFNIIPEVNHGLLLGKIGATGTPFVVGSSLSLTAPYAGQLFLGVNDIDLSNNSGSLSTTTATTAP